MAIADTAYFRDPVFGWLENRIAEVLWAPEQPSLPPRRPPTPLQEQWTVAEWRAWVRARAGREAQRAVASSFEAWMAAEDAKGMSVAEYNQRRGADPETAKRLPYVYQEYPMVLYDGTVTKVVRNADDHVAAVRAGWQETPGTRRRRP